MKLNEAYRYTRRYDIDRWFSKVKYMPEYEIHSDMTVDVYGDLYVPASYKQLPFKINALYGNLRAEMQSNLSTLVNMPNIVTGDFLVHQCKLTSLQGMPHSIGGYLAIEHNKIPSLHNIHKYIKSFGDHLTRDFSISCDFLPNLLGVFFIKGFNGFFIFQDNEAHKDYKREYTAYKIINKNLKDGNIHQCQEELIDAGFVEQAKI